MELSRARFYRVVTEAAEEEHRRGGIGTYREKKLHLILKNYFEEDPACQEVPTAGFIADVRRGDEITEIETAGFSGLCPKLAAYLPDYRVRLVHPLAGKKYVSWIDPETAEISPRRLSPKKESAYDLLFEMDGRPIRRCGSQGQQKSFLVALKFAQYSLMKERCGYAPILLLDDLFDKLDMGRVQNLLTMVAGNDFGQIFLSDCNKVRLSGIVDGITSERTYYEAKGGVFTRNE